MVCGGVWRSGNAEKGGEYIHMYEQEQKRKMELCVMVCHVCVVMFRD